MKTLGLLGILTLSAIIGCQSPSATTDTSTVDAPVPVEAPTPPKREIAIGYDWRGHWDYQDEHIVEMDQGQLNADHLAVCHTSLIADGKISNRLADQCDHIAAVGLAHQKRREAEEKRKDEAYDRAHHKSHP